MSGIFDLLKSDMGQTIIRGVADQTGENTETTNDLLSVAIPVLMQAMKRNTSSPQGAKGLYNALDKHDGSILDDVSGLFEGGVNPSFINDGEKILGHIFGNKQQNVTKALSHKSGINYDNVAQILKVAAPIVMALIGKKSREQNINDPSDLSVLLNQLLPGNSSSHQHSLLEAFLDADGDGSIADDVAGLFFGNSKNKGGLGGLLDGLFGKK